MKVSAELNNLKVSPRKIRLVARLIKGMDVDDAIIQLDNTVKKSSPKLLKLLKSAIANGENNFGLDRNNLYVYDVIVGEGMKLKRWLPRAYGRATLILKRASNVSMVIEERVEGKNRKSKEQIEKEKKERAEEKKKIEKAALNEKEQEAETKEKLSPKKKTVDREEQKGSERGWMKKIFRRKSG